MGSNPQNSLRVPKFLTEGFRYFFLAGPLYGMLAIGIWLLWLGTQATGATPELFAATHVSYQWHAHEMIFGYGAAVMAGFFLTAVPSWTGTEPARERFITSVALLWLMGRVAVTFSPEFPASLVMVIDTLFIPVLGVKILLNLLKRPKPQNMMFLGILAVMTVANVMVHLEWIGFWDDGAAAGNRMGLLTLAALIAVLGGRVTPAFTRNALMRNGVEHGLPRTQTVFDRLGMASALLLPIIYPFAPALITGTIALVAGLANLMRLAGWKSTAILDQPIVWSLHLGFLFLALGYLMLAAYQFGVGIGETQALHVIAIGAVGVMTLAIMTRASLGHTGRTLVVARPIAFAYLLVAAAALTRSLGPEIFTTHYTLVMMVSGCLWITAFAIFAAIYMPILTTHRTDRSA